MIARRGPAGAEGFATDYPLMSRRLTPAELDERIGKANRAVGSSPAVVASFEYGYWQGVRDARMAETERRQGPR